MMDINGTDSSNTTATPPPASSTITTITTMSTTSDAVNGNDEQWGLILGVPIGGIVLIGIIVVLCIVCRRLHRQKRVKKLPPELPPPYALYNARPEQSYQGEGDGDCGEPSSCLVIDEIQHTPIGRSEAYQGTDNPGMAPTDDGNFSYDEDAPANGIYANGNSINAAGVGCRDSTYATPDSLPISPTSSHGTSPTSPSEAGIDPSRLDSQKYLKPQLSQAHSQRPADRKPATLVPKANSESQLNNFKWKIKPPVIHGADQTDPSDQHPVYMDMGANESGRRMSLTPPEPIDLLTDSGNKGKLAPPSPCKGSKGYINVKEGPPELLEDPLYPSDYLKPTARELTSKENNENDDFYYNVDEVFPGPGVHGSHNDGHHRARNHDSVSSDNISDTEGLADNTGLAPKYVNVDKFKLCPPQSQTQTLAQSQHSLQSEKAPSGNTTPGTSEDEGNPTPYINVEKYKKDGSKKNKWKANSKPPMTAPKPKPSPPQSSGSTAHHSPRLPKRSQNSESESDFKNIPGVNSGATGSLPIDRKNNGKRALLPPTAKQRSKSPISQKPSSNTDNERYGAQNHNHQKGSQDTHNSEDGEEIYENAKEIRVHRSQSSNKSTNDLSPQNPRPNGHGPTSNTIETTKSKHNGSSDISASPSEKAKKMAMFGSSSSIDTLGKFDMSELKSRLKKASD